MSKVIHVRLDDKTHARLTKAAKSEDRAASTVAARVIRDAVGGKRK